MMEPRAAIDLFRTGDRWQRLRCKKKSLKDFYFNMEPRLKVLALRPARHIIDDFGDVLPSQSVGLERRRQGTTDSSEPNRTVKVKFHYAIWSQTGPKLVADLQRAGVWPII